MIKIETSRIIPNIKAGTVEYFVFAFSGIDTETRRIARRRYRTNIPIESRKPLNEYTDEEIALLLPLGKQQELESQIQEELGS